MAGEIKLYLLSCSLDISGSAVQQDSMPCIVAVGLQAEQCKLLVSCYTNEAITAYSLAKSKTTLE